VRCPSCGHEEDKVVDSRSTREGRAVRRRRECLACARRFTTYEYIERTPILVVKKDGRREAFEREKLLAGMEKACEKRPISHDALLRIADAIENDLAESGRSEVDSKEVGERVMRQLFDLDEVAYVRFASVYRSFKDLSELMKEIREIMRP
jgi:transcriptional repressor NrdR